MGNQRAEAANEGHCGWWGIAGHLPHLPLSRSMRLPRKKRRGGGYSKAERDHGDFYRSATKKLDDLEKRQDSNKKEYKKYFDPALIFKIKLTQSVSDIFFRDELRRAGIQTLSSTPGKDGRHVVFASDAHLGKFRQKIESRSKSEKTTFIDAIGGIGEIPPEDKLGESLQENPLRESVVEPVDVEIWRMKDERLSNFISGLTTLIKENNGKITDKLLTNDFCVMRIRLNQNLLGILTNLREVAHADRPAVVSVREQLETDILEKDVVGPPPRDSPGILVVDSGIRNHPLLEDSIADSIVLPKRGDRTVEDIDDVGHGTQVAGIALYGDIGSCIDKSFDPRLWLYSAKVMYGDGGYAVFDKDELLEHQFKDAVEKTIAKHKNCRVINVSLGNLDNKMYGKQRQFRLASLIDEISFQNKDVMFTVAAGNNFDVSDRELYPEYMLEESPRTKVIDPATSAHALTVGASFQLLKRARTTAPWPSPFTRVGPGLNGMIKPEVIANGGGYPSDLLTINPRWVSEGRLFTLDSGTSFSSPVIAHYLGMLKGEFPSDSRNMLKALVLSSATIPRGKPRGLGEVVWGRKSAETQKILNVYGYGVPNLDDALASDVNRVLLRYDGKIPLDYVHFFGVMVPKSFLEEKGRRSIEVVLVFDPPTNSNRADYLGVSMSFHIYKNLSMETIQRSYTERKKQDSPPSLLQKNQIKMVPSYTVRNRGVHQKAVQEWSRQPRFNINNPIVLAVTCQKRWHGEDGYEQPYAVVMTIRHEGSADIYARLRMKNEARVRVKGQA